jgi:hypothetical protein
LQDDFVGSFAPPQHLGQAIRALAAADGGADDLTASIADNSPFTATPDFQTAGQDVVLAIAHQRGKWAFVERALIGTWLAK